MREIKSQLTQSDSFTQETKTEILRKIADISDHVRESHLHPGNLNTNKVFGASS